MSYIYSHDRVTPETEGYGDGDTIFDTLENDTEPTDLFSDWTDEDLAEYEDYYDEQQELQLEARNNRE